MAQLNAAIIANNKAHLNANAFVENKYESGFSKFPLSSNPLDLYKQQQHCYDFAPCKFTERND